MVKRPLKFKLDAYRLYIDGASPMEAFQGASALNNNIAPSGCMTTKAYASGYMSDDIKNAIRRKLASGDPEAHAYFDLWSLDKQF